MATAVIWRQYLIEKKNMLAFIRFKPDAVKEILAKLKLFKKNLENKDYGEYQQLIKADGQTALLQHEPRGNSEKQENSQVVDYSKTRTRHVGYFMKVTGYVIALIGIMAWNFLSAEHANKVIYNKPNQIDFALKINEAAGIQYMTMQDTFQNNNSALIRHSSDPYNLSLTELEELRGFRIKYRKYS